MSSRIDGIINRLASADNYDSSAWLLRDPVENIALNVVDTTMKENVAFQGGAGLSPRVVRYTEPSGDKWPCEYCETWAGEYVYPNIPAEVWGRHENCRCIIDYTSVKGERYSLGGRGNNWWWRLSDEELQARQAFAGVDTSPHHVNDMAVKYGKDNYARIERAVANADEEMQAVWGRYVDDINVIKTGNVRGAYFTPREEGIVLNVERDMAGTSYKKALQTTFHEAGHNIDYLAGGRDPFHYYSSKYNNGAFKDAIMEDYNAMVARKEAVLKQAFKEGDRDTLRANGLRLDISDAKYYKRYTYKAIEHEISNGDWVALSSVSDITEGASGAKIRPGFGHSKSYWKSAGSLEKEAFAEFTEAEMVNPEELEALKRYYPKAYSVYREMIEELAK